jgi:hypothetical protein
VDGGGCRGVGTFTRRSASKNPMRRISLPLVVPLLAAFAVGCNANATGGDCSGGVLMVRELFSPHDAKHLDECDGG